MVAWLAQRPTRLEGDAEHPDGSLSGMGSGEDELLHLRKGWPRHRGGIVTLPRPHWFRNDAIMVSTAPTCGISKSGGLLNTFDPITGRPMETTDPDTGVLVP